MINNPYMPVNEVQQPTKSALIFEKKWSSGVCDCFSDWESCCLACWCWPCFLYCLDSNARECPFTTIGIALSSGYCTGIGILRSKIRGAYKIDGSVIEDFCCSLFCPHCTALQIHRELKYQGEIVDE